MVYIPIKYIRMYLYNLGLERVNEISNEAAYNVYVKITKQYDSICVDNFGRDITPMKCYNVDVR